MTFSQMFEEKRMTKPKVYLAAPWVERDKAKEYAAKLEAEGFEITHPWWDYEGENEDRKTDEVLEDCAIKDINGVFTADIVIVINSVKSEGKAVETGMAIAWGKPIIFIGKKALNIFYNLSGNKQVDTIDEAIESAKSYTSYLTGA